MATLEVEISTLVEALAQENIDEVAESLVQGFDTLDLIVAILDQYGEDEQREILRDAIEQLGINLADEDEEEDE
jgi:hypothetical protein